MKILPPWLRRLFGRVKAAAPPPKPVFTVEHYPITGRFYPTYKGRYLQRSHITGIFESLDPFLFIYADYGRTEVQAWKIIQEFTEQQLKENVRVITR